MRQKRTSGTLARINCVLFATVGLACSATTLQASSIISNFSPATNDRFANDPSFIAASHDLSGVGRTLTGLAGGTGGTWGTLIAKNIFLSATHYHSGNNTQMYFYPGNDPSATPVVRTILGGQQIGTSDLWIGHLDFAVPSSIATYNWVQTAGPPTAGSFAYMSGVTTTNTGYGTSFLTTQAVGENKIDLFGANFDPSPPGGTVGDLVVLIQNQTGDAGFPGGFEPLTYEMLTQSGDSGSPLFTLNAGQIEVAGTAWIVGSDLDIDPHPIHSALRKFSGYTYTGNDNTALIQQYVDDNLATTVPEPTSGLLMVLATLCVCTLRRR